MFFAFPCFRPLPNYCEAAFHSIFSSVFQKSLQFFQQAKRRRRAKTLSPDPLMYHWFDVIWHHGVSTDFWSRIDMLWPSIIFEGPPCPVYNLSACQRGACTLSLINFACELFSLVGNSFNFKAPFCSHWFPSNISIWIYYSCAFFQRCDPATWTQEFELSFLSAVSLAACI